MVCAAAIEQTVRRRFFRSPENQYSFPVGPVVAKGVHGR